MGLAARVLRAERSLQGGECPGWCLHQSPWVEVDGAPLSTALPACRCGLPRLALCVEYVAELGAAV
jgi:hypothetical protein